MQSGLRQLVARYGARSLAYLANFGAAKAVTFAAPLVAAAVLPSQTYGAIEFGLSAALLLALALGLGVSSAVPQLLLVGRPMAVVDLLALEVAVGGTLALAAAAVAMLAGQALAAIACAMTAAALAQGVLAAHFRTTSRRNVAVWTDGFATLAMLATVLVLLLLEDAGLQRLLAAQLVVAAAVVVSAAWLFRRFRQPALDVRVRRAVRIGLPLLAYSFVAVWIATSGRLLLGATLGLDAVATFAGVFRIVSCVMVLHAVIAVGLFARIYRLRAREFDRWGTRYAIALALLCMLLQCVLPGLLPLLPLEAIAGPRLVDAQRIVAPVTVLMFAWAMQATLEGRLNRYRIAGRAAIVSGILSTLACGLFLLVAGSAIASLTLLAWIIAGQSIAMVAGQFWVIARRGIVLRRLAAATVTMTSLLVLLPRLPALLAP